MTTECRKNQGFAAACLKRLRAHNLRITEPRKSVAIAIEEVDATFTTSSLHEYIARTRPTLNFATVYRVVQTLQQIGLIHQDGRSPGFFACHHLACDDFIHVIYSCAICAESLESHLSRKLAHAVREAVIEKDRFKSSQAVLQITGVCGSCDASSR